MIKLCHREIWVTCPRLKIQTVMGTAVCAWSSVLLLIFSLRLSQNTIVFSWEERVQIISFSPLVPPPFPPASSPWWCRELEWSAPRTGRVNPTALPGWWGVFLRPRSRSTSIFLPASWSGLQLGLGLSSRPPEAFWLVSSLCLWRVLRPSCFIWACPVPRPSPLLLQPQKGCRPESCVRHPACPQCGRSTEHRSPQHILVGLKMSGDIW